MTIPRVTRMTHARPAAPVPAASSTAATILQPPSANPSVSEGEPGELITPATAADRLSVTAKVLERWRGTGDGPPFVKLTRKTIRYRNADLDAYVADRTRASTAVD